MCSYGNSCFQLTGSRLPVSVFLLNSRAKDVRSVSGHMFVVRCYLCLNYSVCSFSKAIISIFFGKTICCNIKLLHHLVKIMFYGKFWFNEYVKMPFLKNEKARLIRRTWMVCLDASIKTVSFYMDEVKLVDFYSIVAQIRYLIS